MAYRDTQSARSGEFDRVVIRVRWSTSQTFTFPGSAAGATQYTTIRSESHPPDCLPITTGSAGQNRRLLILCRYFPEDSVAVISSRSDEPPTGVEGHAIHRAAVAHEANTCVRRATLQKATLADPVPCSPNLASPPRPPDTSLSRSSGLKATLVIPVAGDNRPIRLRLDVFHNVSPGLEPTARTCPFGLKFIARSHRRH